MFTINTQSDIDKSFWWCQTPNLECYLCHFLFSVVLCSGVQIFVQKYMSTPRMSAKMFVIFEGNEGTTL